MTQGQKLKKQYHKLHKHKEAVHKCNKTIKNMSEKGYIINAVSWFDVTHFHINFSTKEDIERREESIKKVYAFLKEKENKGELTLTSLEENVIIITCIIK